MKKLRKPITVFNIIDVLCVTLQTIEDRGKYVSQKTSDSTGEVSTTKFVVNHLKTSDLDLKELYSKYLDKTNEIRKHFSSPPIEQDKFLETIYNLFSIGMVSEKMIGYIVALPSMYETMYQRTAKLLKIADKYAASSYMGEIGKQDIFTVKLLEVLEFSKKEQEVFFLYRVSDILGNLGFFFSKIPPVNYPGDLTLPIKLWDCFEMRATPCKIEPNKETGIKETQFSKIEIIEIIGKGTEEIL